MTFTFWVEAACSLLPLPWALSTGEMQAMLGHMRADRGGAALLVFTAAFGGVRILSQFYFLAETSPTSLAVSSVFTQVLLVAFGVLIFHEPVGASVQAGVGITVFCSVLYAYAKHVHRRSHAVSPAGKRTPRGGRSSSCAHEVP